MRHGDRAAVRHHDGGGLPGRAGGGLRGDVRQREIRSEFFPGLISARFLNHKKKKLCAGVPAGLPVSVRDDGRGGVLHDLREEVRDGGEGACVRVFTPPPLCKKMRGYFREGGRKREEKLLFPLGSSPPPSSPQLPNQDDQPHIFSSQK